MQQSPSLLYLLVAYYNIFYYVILVQLTAVFLFCLSFRLHSSLYQSTPRWWPTIFYLHCHWSGSDLDSSYSSHHCDYRHRVSLDIAPTVEAFYKDLLFVLVVNLVRRGSPLVFTLQSTCLLKTLPLSWTRKRRLTKRRSCVCHTDRPLPSLPQTIPLLLVRT